MSKKNQPAKTKTWAQFKKEEAHGILEAKLGAIARGDAVIKNGKVVYTNRDR